MEIKLEKSYFTRFGNTPHGFTIQIINEILNNSFVDILDLISFLNVNVSDQNDILIYGRGGSHVWISDKKTGERILIIIFE